jgi:hypothetical protein
VGTGLGTIGVPRNGAGATGPAVAAVTSDRWVGTALTLPTRARAGDSDPPLAEGAPFTVVGRMAGTAPAVGGTRAPAPMAMGGATVRTTGLASDGACWIVLADIDEMSDTAASATGTTEAVDPATAASGTLPETDWTPGTDGGSGSALAPAG